MVARPTTTPDTSLVAARSVEMAVAPSAILTARQTAEFLKISEVTLRKVTKLGELPAAPVGFGQKRLHVRYDLADLRSWIDQRKKRLVQSL